MIYFPLYDNLNKDIPKKDLTVSQKEDFVKRVTSAKDTKVHELIFALVCTHHMNTNDNTFGDLVPYKAITTNNENEYQWNFLIFLFSRHILYKYIVMHDDRTQKINLNNIE